MVERYGTVPGRSSENIQRPPCGSIVIHCRIPWPSGVPLSAGGSVAAASLARHSKPPPCDMTTPRQYISASGGMRPSGNSARKATAEEFVKEETLPGDNSSEKPEADRRLGPSCN